jgi:hypothetical protein
MLANGNALAIGINQNFLAVKAISARRIARTIDAVSVKLSGHDSGDKDVPVMRSAINGWIERYDPVRLLSFGVIEEHDLDSRGMG